ncbi:MAG: ROK family protein [Acidobacteriota bacterium]|nr:ROK family protein [Acidobacteriota bacterium]
MANTDSSSASSSTSVLLGVDLGTNHIRLGTIDRSGKVLAFRREHYPEGSLDDARSLANQLVSAVSQMIEEQAVTAPVAAVGVAFPGQVHQLTQRAISVPNLPDLSKLDLQRELADKFGVPVYFDNNANAAAFAEMNCGIARGVNDFLYLHIGSKVSAGMVLGGKLQRGKSGLAGDVGQMNIYAEHLGGFVRLESMASAENIVRRTRDRLQRDRTSSLSRLGAMGGFSYDDIIEQAHRGDDLARLMLQRTASFISLALADVISLLNLEMIAVGGAPAGRPLLVATIAEESRQRASAAAFEDCRIVAAEIGAEATVIGAALLAAQMR